MPEATQQACGCRALRQVSPPGAPVPPGGAPSFPSYSQTPVWLFGPGVQGHGWLQGWGSGRAEPRAPGRKRAPLTLTLAVFSAPPEEPQLSCERNSPVSNVVCEWGPRSAPSPATKATLLVMKL